MGRIKIDTAGKFDFDIIFECKCILTLFKNVIDIWFSSGKKDKADLGNNILGIWIFLNDLKKYMIFASISIVSLDLPA